MQEYKRLIDDVIGQLRAGFDEMVHRQQAEAARAQKKYDQDIASLQKQHGEEIAQLKRCHRDEMSSLRYELEQKLEIEQQKCMNLQTELSAVQFAREKAEQLNDYYDERYYDAERIAKLIHKLSDRTSEGVKASFGCQPDDDGLKLLFGIVQEKHLDSAWLYMSNAINEGLASAQDREIFKEVMIFAIHAVAGVDKVAAYEIIMAEPGQGFDAGCMGRAKDSSQLGKVQEMLLPGYRYVGSGKVVHPALVLLRKS